MRHEETLARASAKGSRAFDFSGEWTNELSSTMDIIQEESVLTGVYASSVSGEDTPVTGQLSGYAQGDLISFTVKWDSWRSHPGSDVAGRNTARPSSTRYGR